MGHAAPPARWSTVVGALALSEIVSWGIRYYAFGALVSAEAHGWRALRILALLNRRAG